MKKNSAIVFGAGGFIGSHLVNRLKSEGYWVRGVDLKYPEFSKTQADEFIIGDLRDGEFVNKVIVRVNEVYQLAADMGGAGYIFTGLADADIMHNSAILNLNILDRIKAIGADKIFYSSSACVYPEYRQKKIKGLSLSEEQAYPAQPDSEYGWEKLFSERLFLSYYRNYNLPVRIARFHNIFGPQGTWNGGKEKAPAAICRKVAEAKDGGSIEVWGDGQQTRSFLYIDECLEGVRRLMVKDDFTGPVNIGSEEMVTINELAKMTIKISGKNLTIKHINGPLGVRARTSDNTLIKKILRWSPNKPLHFGLKKTYFWIYTQVHGT